MKRRSRKADEAGGYRIFRRMPLRIGIGELLSMPDFDTL